jgi:ribonuclease HIII
LIKARQLKVALMSWISCSTLPLDPKIYNFIFKQYKNDIFWKIMHKKDSLPAIGGLKQLEAELL